MAALPRVVALVAALLFCGVPPAFAQPPAGSLETAKDAKPAQSRQDGPAPQQAAVDSLGDPLPPGARLRLGLRDSRRNNE